MLPKGFQSDFILLREAEKNGSSWKVLLIEEGMSKNGRFYPAEVLRKAVNLFDKVKAYFYEWKEGSYDHLPIKTANLRPEGFPRQIAGWYSEPKFEEIDVEGQKKKGITATFHIHSGAKWLKEMLKDAWNSGMRQLLGLSIDADGNTATQYMNSKPIEVVTALNKIFGVDLVTHPAAGGQFVRLLASLQKKEGFMGREAIIEMLKKLRPELLEGLNIDETSDEKLKEILEGVLKEDDDEDAAKKKAEEEKAAAEKKAAEDKAAQEAKEAKEAEERKQEAVSGEATLKQALALLKDKKYEEAANLLKKWMEKYPEAKKDKYPYKEEIESLAQKISAMDDKLVIAECNKILDKKLAETKLPEVVKNKVAKKFRGKNFKESEIDEALKDEKDMLADLTKDGDVDLGEVADIEMGRTGAERLQCSLDLMLEPKVEDSEKKIYESIQPFKSLREAYVKITGDTEITGVVSPKRLREATSGDFTYMLGVTMNRKLARDYKLEPALWQDLADVVSVKDFKTQEVIRWGGFANLETFTESDSTDYSTMAFPGDEEATYSVATKGGLVLITRKMIINDDLRSLNKIPSKIARAAARTLNQFVFDLMMSYSASGINTANIYDSAVLYIAQHFNLGTAALDYDSFGDAVDRMREQKETGAKLTGDTTVSASETADISFASGATAVFKVGDYVQCESEFIGPLSAVAATYISVASTAQRGIWGSTAAQHASAVWKVVTDDLMLEPGILWVPTDLRTTGEAILLSDKIDDTLANRNPYKGMAQLKVIPRRYLRGDVNNWYLTAKKADIELIELGFLGGKQEPELLRQDAPGVGLVFTRDVISFKVRHEYGGAVIDFRGFQGNIVS